MFHFLSTNRVRLAAAAVVLSASVLQVSAATPAAEWHFDEGSGIVARDSSGNGNHGTLNGGAAWTSGYGTTPGLLLNGTSGYVTVPASASLNASATATIAFWINPQAVSGWDPRIVVRRSSWEIKLNGSRPQFTANGTYAVINASLLNGHWQHVAFTFSSGTVKAYLNGALQTFLANTFQAGTTLRPSPYGLTIGADPSPIQFAKGVMDSVRFYNEALTDADIQSLYLKNTISTPPPPTTTTGPQVIYASTSGSDSVSCTQAQTITSPKRTINSAAACLRPGDTLFVRAGVYAENLDDAIPSGTSWTAPVTVSAYPGETVTIQPAGGQFVFQSTRGSYIVLDGLIFDGSKVLYDAVGITFGPGSDRAHHIRIKNSEVRKAPRTGIGIHQGDANHRTDYNEFINVSVHDNGTTDLHHGFYVESSYNLIDGVNVYNNSGWGLQAYTGVSGWPIHGNTIRNSVFRDNARAGTRGVGIGIYNGAGNAVYNNVVYNNSGGITVNYGASGTKVYNNTVYNNNRGVNRYGIYNGNDVDNGRTGSAGAEIYNNICFGNVSDLKNSRSDAKLSNNLTGKDPKFVNAAAGNFRLSPGSPAINAGVNTGPLVTMDKDGVARPQAGAYDIGAYEYR